jgi:hypothetical protein
MMPADLVKRVVEACGWRAKGELGKGVVRLMRRMSREIGDQGDSAARRVERPLEEDYLRCLDDHHVCSQVCEKRGLLLALLNQACKGPLVRLTSHERVLDDQHVCSILSLDGCRGLFCAG